jgi:hypothetical protein
MIVMYIIGGLTLTAIAVILYGAVVMSGRCSRQEECEITELLRKERKGA